MKEPLLEMKNITKSFAKVTLLHLIKRILITFLACFVCVRERKLCSWAIAAKKPCLRSRL